MIGLVSCASMKLDRAAPARELYCSPLFKMSMRYAERYCDRVYIISAKHGLVPPPLVIAPYELRLAGLPIAQRRAWGVDVMRRFEAAHPNSEVMLLAGEVYAAAIRWGACRPDLRAAERPTWITPIREPIAGMQIGERLQWLTGMLKEVA